MSSRPERDNESCHNIKSPTKPVRPRPSVVPSNHPRTRSSGGDAQPTANQLPLKLRLAEFRGRRVSWIACRSCMVAYSNSINPLGGRHAAVIPALPEEYDASLPIGTYYPRRDEVVESELPRGLSYYPQHIIAQAEAQRVTRPVRSQTQLDSPAETSGSFSTIASRCCDSPRGNLIDAYDNTDVPILDLSASPSSNFDILVPIGCVVGDEITNAIGIF